MRLALGCLIVAAALLAPAAAQSTWRVEGIVVDETGEPVPLAKLHVEVRRPVQAHVAPLLRRSPLPHSWTAKDGRFGLLFQIDHLALARHPTTRLQLVVERDGHRSWFEQLPTDLRKWRAGTIRLPKTSDDERTTLRVRPAIPGSVVLVKHSKGILDSALADELAFTRAYPLPAHGVVRFDTPVGPDFSVTTRLEAVVIAPGFSGTHAFPLGKDSTIELGDGWENASSGVARTDGRPVTGLRMLHRCPDGEVRWFPMRDGVLRFDALTRAIAVTADGCRIAPVPGHGYACKLEPLTANTESRERKLVDELGFARDGVHVRRLPFELWPWHTRLDRRYRRIPAEVSDERGVVTLPPLDPAVPSFVLFERDGSEPRAFIEVPDGTIEIRSQKFAALHLEVTTGDGSPPPHGVPVSVEYLSGRLPRWGKPPPPILPDWLEPVAAFGWTDRRGQTKLRVPLRKGVELEVYVLSPERMLASHDLGLEVEEDRRLSFDLQDLVEAQFR